jgi:hypothetical protein
MGKGEALREGATTISENKQRGIHPNTVNVSEKTQRKWIGFR